MAPGRHDRRARSRRRRRAVTGRPHHPSTSGRRGRRGLPHGVRRSGLPEDGAGLERRASGRRHTQERNQRERFMSDRRTEGGVTVQLPDSMQARLRAEASIEPDPVPTGEPAKETQIIAIYGKGGIGKSFTLSNLSYMMAQQGKKVLLFGCKACPTIIETSSKKKLAGEDVEIGDVCFVRDGVFAMELGGPEVGRGCGGRGIIHGFELLEKLGFHEWGFDYVLLDFLGDVVCGGFGLPIARDMCQKVIVVAANDLQSLYVANNVCSAVEYFRKLGGNVGVAGMVTNKDDGSGEAQAFCKAVGIPELASSPAHDDIRRKSANYEIIGFPEGEWGSLFGGLAKNVAEAPPHHPTPLTPDGLLDLFSSDTTGRDVVLQPATQEDLCSAAVLNKESLEVIYDTV